MKMILKISVLYFFLSINFSPVYADSIVIIEDLNLRTAIKETLGLVEDYEITENELLKLKTIDISNRNITSLSGLEKAYNLRSINGDNNNISDISSLKDILLNWQSYGKGDNFNISLSNNKITNIDFLQEIPTLPKYSVLTLENNYIQDFSPVAHFAPNTFYFSIRNNQYIYLDPVVLTKPEYSLFIPYVNTGFPLEHISTNISNSGIWDTNSSTAMWKNLTSSGSLSFTHSSYQQGPFAYSVTYIQEYTLANLAVTVKYQDTEGNTIAPDVVSSGNVGDSYTSEQLTIDGYTFKEVLGNPNGTFMDTPKTVIYVYSKNLVPGADVTIKYQDTDGNAIAPDIIKSGNAGDSYFSDNLIIDGYTFKEVIGTPNGTFTDSSQTVTYIYMKNKINTPVEPTKPTGSNSKPVSVDKTTSNSSASKTIALPKTGETNSPLFTVIGSITLLVSGAYVLTLKRKKN